MDLNQIGTQLKDLYAAEAVAFVAGHAPAVSKLGENAVRSILRAEVHRALPIPNLPADAPPDALAAFQEVLAARRNDFQLVADAERHDAAMVGLLKHDATKIAGKVAGATLGILLSVGTKALLGLLTPATS